MTDDQTKIRCLRDERAQASRDKNAEAGIM